MSFHPLYRTAGHLLAAAVLELFPDVQILGGDIETIGFYRDFTFSQEFRPEYLPLIEERMRAILARDPELRVFEMVPTNAQAFLKKERQQRVLPNHSGTLIQLCQIERLIDVCTGPILKNWEKFEAAMLTEYQLVADESVRIFGIASSNRQTLQHFAKKLKAYAKLMRGKEFFSVDESGWCFLPKGVQLRKTILDFWSRECAKEGFQEIVASKDFNSLPEKSARCIDLFDDISGIEKRFLGLFAPKQYTADRLNFSAAAKENLISPLQFARKFTRIFDFEPEWVLGKRSPPILREALEACEIPFQIGDGTQLEWQVRDGLNRAWTIGFLRIDKGRATLSLFYALERFIALLLEKKEDGDINALRKTIES